LKPIHTNEEAIRKAIIAHPMDRSHLAAEQRAAVAHGASHGFGRTYISKAPDGAAENRFEMRLNLPPQFSGSTLFHPAIRFIQSPAK
jgi:hypothetical protein